MFEMTEANGITMIDESDSDDNNNMEDDKITIPSFSNYLIITLCFIMLCMLINNIVVQL